MVTAPRRLIEGKYNAHEAYVQTNDPAGGGASGAPVFDLAGKLIGIHEGGLSEPGFEERSTHISFAAPVERLAELVGGTDEILGFPTMTELAISERGGEASAGFAEFLLPLADDSETYLGEHGALSRHARRVASPWMSSTLRAVGDAAQVRQLTVARAAGRSLDFGAPLRILALRIDRSDTFFVGKRAVSGARRLPWFLAGQRQNADARVEPPTSSLASGADDLGSL